jgi:hypothetical protein
MLPVARILKVFRIKPSLATTTTTTTTTVDARDGFILTTSMVRAQDAQPYNKEFPKHYQYLPQRLS